MKTHTQKTLQNRRGFTLVELVVVLVVLGMIASFAVPALTNYIDDSRQKQVVSETQACVMAATTLAAQARASGELETNWKVDSGAITPPKGTVALQEGSGTYIITAGGTTTFAAADENAPATQIMEKAGVEGTVNNVICSQSGQIRYLEYTNNGITVAYTNDGNGNITITPLETPNAPIPVAPSPSTAPEPEPEPVPDPITVTIRKVDGDDTDELLSGAKLQLTGPEGFTTQEWTTGSSAYAVTLPQGSYTLTEITPPANFNTADSITFSVVRNGNVLTLQSDNSAVDTTNDTITMTDIAKKTTYTIWATDIGGTKLSGVNLKITGDDFVGKVDKKWTSSDTEGKVFELRANTSNKTYTLRFDDDKDNSSYQTEVPYNKVKFKVNENGTISVKENAENIRIDGNDIYFICRPVAKENKTLILNGVGVTVTIEGVEPWPERYGSAGSMVFEDGKNTHAVTQGSLYYYGDESNPDFYSVFGTGTLSANDNNNYFPTSVYWYTNPIGNEKMTLWTENSLHYADWDSSLVKVKMGDYLVYNDTLYMYTSNASDENAVVLPGETYSPWLAISTDKYIITIEESEPNVSISAVDAATTDEKLTGAQLMLKDSSGNILRWWTTDKEKDEEIYLDAGTYYVEEKTAPTGYQSRSSNRYEFTVSETGQTVQVPYTLLTKKFTISTKLSGGNSAVPGATVTISGTPTATNKTFTTKDVTTGADGTIEIDLPYGTYTVANKAAPTGYKYEYGNDTFTVGSNGATEKTLYYSQLKVAVTFVWKDQNGTEVKETINAIVTEPGNDPVSINAYNPQSLPMGSYVVSETNSPAGYTKAEDTPFEITEADLNTGTKTVTLQRIKIPDLQVYKVDGDGKPLEGATLCIQDSSNNKISNTKWQETWNDASSTYTVVSPDNQEWVKSGKLVLGVEYTLKELTTPSNEYALAEDIQFTLSLDENGKLVVTYDDEGHDDLRMVNTKIPKATVQLVRKDSLDDSMLDLGTVTVTDGTTVYTPDSEGKVYLPAGSYTYASTETPSGYAVAPNVQFTITDAQASGTNTITQTLLNAPLLTVNVADESGTLLPGATINIYKNSDLNDDDNRDPTPVYSWTSSATTKQINLVEQGFALNTEYCLIEKTAPTAVGDTEYQIPTPITFTLIGSSLAGGVQLKVGEGTATTSRVLTVTNIPMPDDYLFIVGTQTVSVPKANLTVKAWYTEFNAPPEWYWNAVIDLRPSLEKNVVYMYEDEYYLSVSNDKFGTQKGWLSPVNYILTPDQYSDKLIKIPKNIYLDTGTEQSRSYVVGDIYVKNVDGKYVGYLCKTKYNGTYSKKTGNWINLGEVSYTNSGT